jgi:hypothetical protein
VQPLVFSYTTQKKVNICWDKLVLT